MFSRTQLPSQSNNTVRVLQPETPRGITELKTGISLVDSLPRKQSSTTSDDHKSEYVYLDPASSPSSLTLKPLLSVLARGRKGFRASARIKIAGPLTKVSYSSGVATGFPSWDPTGLADFVSLATLFTEYSVRSFYVDVTFPPVSTTTDWTTSAYIGDDPADLVSASTTSLAQMDGATKLTSFGMTHRHTAKVSQARGNFATPIPDGGWLPIDASFPGRTLIVSESANSSSSAVGHVYVAVWTVDFRVRV